MKCLLSFGITSQKEDTSAQLSGRGEQARKNKKAERESGKTSGRARTPEKHKPGAGGGGGAAASGKNRQRTANGCAEKKRQRDNKGRRPEIPRKSTPPEITQSATLAIPRQNNAEGTLSPTNIAGTDRAAMLPPPSKDATAEGHRPSQLKRIAKDL